MRRIFCLVFVFLLIPLGAFAEETLHEQTDDYVREVPASYQRNISSLTRWLTAPYNNDYDKARAIAYYIASHMLYDSYLYNENGRTKLKYRRQTPEEFLKSRVGICADFAALFQEMCQLAGIPVQTIKGYMVDKTLKRKDEQQNKVLHAWNAFRYHNRIIYVDTTLMASAETGHEKRVSEFRRRKALNKVKRQTKRSNPTYDIEPFYFDFSYAKEKQLGIAQHTEK